jgi:hypothetical protein
VAIVRVSGLRVNCFGDLAPPVHGIIGTVRPLDSADPKVAEFKQHYCKEPRDERVEAVHLYGVDWCCPEGATYSALGGKSPDIRHRCRPLHKLGEGSRW